MGKWRDKANNERGAAALTYVFMLVFVLAAAVPVVLMLLSNSAASLQAYRNGKLAERLALGGMESLFAYLRAYPEDGGVARTDWLEDYPGFVERSYRTPENVPVRYRAEIASEYQGNYIVRVEAEAGAGAAKRRKTVEYMFTPAGPGGLTDPRIVTDDSQRVVVPPGGGFLYVGGSYHEPSIINADPTSLENLPAIIGTAIDYYKRRAYDDYEEWIDTWLPAAQPVSCNPNGNCHQDSVWEGWAANLPDPPVLAIPSANYYAAIDVTFGSPANPVVLILENRPTFNNLKLTVYGTVIFPQGLVSSGIDLTVYGNVVFGEGISPTTAFNVTTRKLNGEGGNMYVLGAFTPTNAPNLDIAGDFYADSVRLSNASRISAGGKIIVGGELRLQNSMFRFSAGQDILAGSLYTCCTNRLDAGGDILIEGSIERQNPIRLSAGGSIGVGGDIAEAPWHPVTVETGGGTTSLIVPSGPDGGGGSGGPGGGTGGWNPVRIS